MIVDRAWAERNIGFDPTKTTAPASTYAHLSAAAPGAEPDDLQREIIDFDSEGPEGAAFLVFTKSTGLSRFTPIPWPTGLAPQTGRTPSGGGAGPLPQADVLVVTWTVDEGHALSRVLTPGKDSRDDYVPYTHNYGRDPVFRQGQDAVQGERGPVALGQHPTPEHRDGFPGRPLVIRRHDGFFRLRHVEQHLQALEPRRRIRDGRRGAWHGGGPTGVVGPALAGVRNVSDPEIKATGLTLKQQAALAANIYKAFGRWSSVCSAIVCWALIAALQSGTTLRSKRPR